MVFTFISYTSIGTVYDIRREIAMADMFLEDNDFETASWGASAYDDERSESAA